MKKLFFAILILFAALFLQGAAAVAPAPLASLESGVYDGVSSVAVELGGAGAEIHYTLDGSRPDERSPVYSEPIVLEKTAVVRAVCYKEGFAPSRTVTYNYIINEHPSLPVLCLNVDNPWLFLERYSAGGKGSEHKATLALYEDGKQVFSRACGVDLRGGAALFDAKKTLGVWFRSSYGDGRLRDIDLFGDGKKDYSSLFIRGGQDYHSCVIRDSLCGALCKQMGDSVPVQNSKYCILYINGEYYGIHCLKEHMNRSFFAALDGVEKKDVRILKATNTFGQISSDVEFSEDCKLVKKNFAAFSNEFDIDNLIDYLIIQGYCGNWDLKENVRFVKTTADGGKWRAYFFDGDMAFYGRNRVFKNILEDGGNAVYQVQSLFNYCLQNRDFSRSLLARYDELLAGVLSDENVLREIDDECAILAPEIERDFARWGLNPEQWEQCIGEMKDMIASGYGEHARGVLVNYIEKAK